MIALCKRDFYMYGWSLLGLIVVMPLLTAMQPEVAIMAILIALMIHLFFYDYKSLANRYLVSLPVSKKIIVGSRYLFIVLMAMVVVVVQWLLNIGLTQTNGIFQPYIYSWKDMIVLLSFFLILSSICLPMYYYFANFMMTLYLQFGMFLVGAFFFSWILIEHKFGGENEFWIDNQTIFLAPWIESILSFYPYLLLPVIAICMYVISMRFSEKLLGRRDL
ncbi:ABC-2 transporter permease [Aquibacillus koreensis]|uniref:ABC-2 transporter permease n=1 Tax=Aquibacillus koreensis TaxID=279446 RepID=A0A9X4AJV3_9BACI|nr:ABC-2 transporter permease [Aquibacillus koreensis]MCT2536232.1 ABC-2 transporter permease [Aquibacillus koreensis]MDC3422214.1 ABC-2 transporter permease [Aquibacillus koreensis]